MLFYFRVTPTRRAENCVNLLELTLAIYLTDYLNTHLYIQALLLILQLLKRLKCLLFGKRNRNFISRTAITLTFKMRWFPNKARF